MNNPNKYEGYTVIWRGDEDEFMFTWLSMRRSDYKSISNDELIRRAWVAEYGVGGLGENPYGDGKDTSYELLEVLRGPVEYVGRL